MATRDIETEGRTARIGRVNEVDQIEERAQTRAVGGARG